MRRTIANATRAEIRTAHASGIGLREIARNMGIPAGTILSRAKREGWTREIQNAKALAKREDAAPAVTTVHAVAVSMQQRGERHVGRMANIVEAIYCAPACTIPAKRESGRETNDCQVPCSTISPRFSTIIASALRTVDSRCAITTTVSSPWRRWMAS